MEVQRDRRRKDQNPDVIIVEGDFAALEARFIAFCLRDNIDWRMSMVEGAD